MRALVLAVVCLAAACSSFSGAPTPADGTDAGTDSGVDAGAGPGPADDGGRSDGPDAATDAPADAPTDASTSLRIFVSSTAYNGNLAGLGGATVKCANLGNQTPLRNGKHDFIALIADMNGNPPALTPGGRVDLLDRPVFETTPMTTSVPKRPITVTEDGKEAVSVFSVWTGASLAASSQTCGEWKTESETVTGGTGITSAAAFWWNVGSATPCDVDTYHLYCIEQ